MLVGSLALGLLMAAAAPLQAQTVVISQVSGGDGGASGAPYRQDFVELHNVGQAPVVLDGLSLQYAAPSGFQTFGENAITPLTGTLPAGGYHLVQMAAGANGAALPAPDAFGSVELNFVAGKVVLARGVDALMCNGGTSPCDNPSLARIVDLVGYGSADFFEGSGAATGAWTNLGLLRAGDGCTDTNDNVADFAAGPPAPRNHASPGVPARPRRRRTRRPRACRRTRSPRCRATPRRLRGPARVSRSAASSRCGSPAPRSTGSSCRCPSATATRRPRTA